MQTGSVNWFNANVGYGFLTPNDGSKDVFVHVSDVEKAQLGRLSEGQKLGFDVAEDATGRSSAINLQAV